MSPLRAVPLIVAALLLGLTFLVVQSVAPDEPLHERTLDTLRALDLEGAALQRDVLRGRAGLLQNYDPLVVRVDRLRESAPSLQPAGSGGTSDVGSITGRAVEELIASVHEQEDLVERLKWQNALLQKWLRIFSHALRQLGGEGGSCNGATNALIGMAASSMLRLTSDPQPQAAAEAAAAVDRLLDRLGDPELALGLHRLVEHGQLVVATLPVLDAMVARIQASDTSNRTKAVQQSYLRAYGRATERAGHFRFMLYATAVALVAYALLLFLRLRSAQLLRQRLAFESLVASVSAKFITLPRKRIREGIDEALALLARQAGVDRAGVALLAAADERAPGRIYEWRRDGLPDRPGGTRKLLDMAMDRHRAGGGLAGLVHVRNVAQLASGPDKERLTALGVRAWLCRWRWGTRTAASVPQP